MERCKNYPAGSIGHRVPAASRRLWSAPLFHLATRFAPPGGGGIPFACMMTEQGERHGGNSQGMVPSGQPHGVLVELSCWYPTTPHAHRMRVAGSDTPRGV